MQHAILITAYKNFEQLTDLVDTFDDTFRCYIHIDKKSLIDEALLELLRKRSNVDFVDKHYKVNWGGVNHLLSAVLLLREAAKNTQNDYFHFITGQDYPIKSIKDIHSFFEQNAGKEYMEYHKMPRVEWEHGGYDRIDYYNMCDTFNRKSAFGRAIIKPAIAMQRVLRLKRRYYKGFPELYGGSTYWSLSKPCVQYAVDYLAKNPQFLTRFNSTFCAEEFFFQTLVLNSPFAKNVVNDPLRFIVWEERNGNYPANLDLTDEQKLFESNAIFARKFEPPVSTPLLEKIKEKIHS